MKSFIKFIMGDFGLLLTSMIFTMFSYFLIPLFISVLTTTSFLYSILGWLFICPIALMFYISALFSGTTLLAKGIKNKKWLSVVLAILILILDIAILLINIF